MWSAFVTGFASKATDLIEERDKEIQDNIKVQLSEMYKSRQKALQTSETRKDELKKTASQLRGYGLPDAAIGEIITSGDSATITELLQKEALAGTLTPEKITQFLGERSGERPSEALDSIIQKLTTPVKSTTRTPLELATEMRGAFGLKGSGERTLASGLATLGMSKEELEATQLPDVPLSKTVFDYSVLGEDTNTFAKMKERAKRTLVTAEKGTPEYKSAEQELLKIIEIDKLGEDGGEKSFAAVESRARKAVLEAKNPKEESTAMANLNRVLAVKAIGEKDKDGEVKETDVRSNLRILVATVQQRNAGPGDLVMTRDPDTGVVGYTYSKTIKPEKRQQIDNAITGAITGYAREHYALAGGRLPEQVQRVVSAFTPASVLSPPIPQSTPGGQAQAPAGTQGQRQTARAAAGSVTVTHNGKTYTFPNQEAANSFKKDMGIN